MSKSKGLGDSIEKFTKVTGIKKLVETINGGDCTPCQRRQQILNEIFPYSNNKPLKENIDEFKDGIYVVQKDTQINVDNHIVTYKAQTKLFINKENKNYEMFEKLYRLGVLKFDNV